MTHASLLPLLTLDYRNFSTHMLVYSILTRRIGKHINGTLLMTTKYALSLSSDYRITMWTVLTTCIRDIQTRKAWVSPRRKHSASKNFNSTHRLIPTQPAEQCKLILARDIYSCKQLYYGRHSASRYPDVCFPLLLNRLHAV